LLSFLFNPLIPAGLPPFLKEGWGGFRRGNSPFVPL